MINVRDRWYRPIANCKSVGELVERSGLTVDEILQAIGGNGWVRGVYLEPEWTFVKWIDSIMPNYVRIERVGSTVIARELKMSKATVMRIVKSVMPKLQKVAKDEL